MKALLRNAETCIPHVENPYSGHVNARALAVSRKVGIHVSFISTTKVSQLLSTLIEVEQFLILSNLLAKCSNVPMLIRLPSKDPSISTDGPDGPHGHS